MYARTRSAHRFVLRRRWLVPTVEYQGNKDQFHVPRILYESPVPSSWRPSGGQTRTRCMGASKLKEEIEEVEAAIAAVRERLAWASPWVRVGEENEVLKVVTEEDFFTWC